MEAEAAAQPHSGLLFREREWTPMRKAFVISGAFPNLTSSKFNIVLLGSINMVFVSESANSYMHLEE